MGGFVHVLPFGGGGGGRTVLAANRTYYVRTDGSDSNTGLADNAGGAFLTIQKAIDVVQALDLSIYDVTIQVRSGTYTGAILVDAPWVGAGTVSLVGDTTTPSNVIISVAGNALTVKNGAVLTLGGFKITTSAGTAGGLTVTDFGTVNVTGAMEYGACNTAQMIAVRYGNITITANYTVSGNAVLGLSAQEKSRISHGTITVTLTGTPAFTIHVRSQQISYVNLAGVTYSGSATGQRYVVESHGVIQTPSGSTTFIPGNSAGSGTNAGASPYGLYL